MVVVAKPRHLNLSGQPIDGSEFHVTVYSNYMHPIEVLPWIIMFKEQNTSGNYNTTNNILQHFHSVSTSLLELNIP